MRNAFCFYDKQVISMIFFFKYRAKLIEETGIQSSCSDSNIYILDVAVEKSPKMCHAVFD